MDQEQIFFDQQHEIYKNMLGIHEPNPKEWTTAKYTFMGFPMHSGICPYCEYKDEFSWWLTWKGHQGTTLYKCDNCNMWCDFCCVVVPRSDIVPTDYYLKRIITTEWNGVIKNQRRDKKIIKEITIDFYYQM